MTNELWFAVALIGAAWYWLHARRLNELALAATRNYCLDAEVQLLDDYVALTKLRLVRDSDGRLKIQRTYLFEFSSTGNERYHGRCIMLGSHLEKMFMQPYRMV